MDKEKVNQFLMINGKNFPEESMPLIKKKLEDASDAQFESINMMQWKNPVTALLFAFFLGNLGADRFYLGDTGLGVAKLLTCGCVGIWSIIDLFTVSKRTKKYNFNKLQLSI